MVTMDWNVVCAVRFHILARVVYWNVIVVRNTAITFMDVKFHKVHQFYVCLIKTFTKQNKTQTQINHNFNYLVLEIKEDTTLSLSYGYTPLDVQLATSTHTYNKIGKFLFISFCCHKCYIQYAYFFHCMVNSCFF